MGRLVPALAGVILIAISIPTVIVLATSVTGADSLAFPPHGFSLKWYHDLLAQSTLRDAMLRSFIVGGESVLIALFVAVPAAIGLFRHRVRFRPLMVGYLSLGFSAPLIVSGIAFLIIFVQAGFIGTLLPLALALTIVDLPFMLFAVGASIVSINPELEEAASTLGAERVQIFLFVVLPLLMPGIVTGALLMFVFAISEFLVSLVLTVPSDQTLPVVIFSSIRGDLSPILAAAAGMYTLVAFLVVFILARCHALDQFISEEP
jgi:putative spermidine/putrescine transport system permease protein